MSKPLVISGERDRGVERALDTYVASLRGTGGEQIDALIRGGEGQGVGAALYKAPPFQVSVPALPVSRLSVNLTSTRVGAGIGGEPLLGFDSPRYALFLTPAEIPMVFRKDVPSRHINIYFHAERFGDGDLLTPLDVSQPLLNMVVPGIRNLVDQLVDELDKPAMLNGDAADCLARLLLVQLARYRRNARSDSHRLAPSALARLRDFVMANLSERILVADMAEQAHLSPDRFALAFKETTGHTPHQFVMAMRLECAADLLRGSTLSLAEIAYKCGFASQQHFSNVMRKQLGVTPGRYRASK